MAATKRKTTAKKTTRKTTTTAKKKAVVKKPAARKTAVRKTTTTRKPATKSKTTAKKAPVKRKTVTKRKTAAPKSTASASKSKLSVGSKPFTKTQFVGAISEQTGLSRKEVGGVLDVISDIIGMHLKKRGPSAFSWPGIMKMKVVKKPATKSRKGINPFTGEPTVFKAKPASRKVKILPLKQLKEMADG